MQKNMEVDLDDNSGEYISNQKNALNSLSNKLESILESIRNEKSSNKSQNLKNVLSSLKGSDQINKDF